MELRFNSLDSWRLPRSVASVNLDTLDVTVTNQYSFHEVLTITKPLTTYLDLCNVAI